MSRIVLPPGRRRVVDGDNVCEYDPDLNEFEWSDDLERCVVTGLYPPEDSDWDDMK